MALPIKQNPSCIKRHLRPYKKILTKPQFKQFRKGVIGHIISDKKNIQEINDCFSDRNQSSLNRFFTSSRWDEEAINDVRIEQVKKNLKPRNKGILVIDPTHIHKSGRRMEKANYHYSGRNKSTEWGYSLVDSFFSTGEYSFPLRADMYIREEDSDEKHPFKKTRDICYEHIDYALKKNLPLDIVMIDGGLYADFLLKKIKRRSLNYIAGAKVTMKISLNNYQGKVSIGEYMDTLREEDFEKIITNKGVYYLHKREIYKRKVGKELLLISYKEGDEEKRIYTTNILNYTSEELMSTLLRRWDIEVLHRDAKQHLGLEDYQIRKFDAIQKVVCVVLMAYTLIVLSKFQKILKPLNRSLQTIGEGCRFFRLIALRGRRWMKETAKDLTKLKRVLNRFVFVKNAKV